MSEQEPTVGDAILASAEVIKKIADTLRSMSDCIEDLRKRVECLERNSAHQPQMAEQRLQQLENRGDWPWWG